jgi:hypothetical protein
VHDVMLFVSQISRCELTASQLVNIATRSDTGSHNRRDLIQSLVPTHYMCMYLMGIDIMAIYILSD